MPVVAVGGGLVTVLLVVLGAVGLSAAVLGFAFFFGLGLVVEGASPEDVAVLGTACAPSGLRLRFAGGFFALTSVLDAVVVGGQCPAGGQQRRAAGLAHDLIGPIDRGQAETACANCAAGPAVRRVSHARCEWVR